MSEVTSSFPQIRIKNGWLLTNTVSPYLPAFHGGHRPPVPTHEAVDIVVDAYKAAWEPKETRIVQGICHILDLSFRQNVIDAYIAPRFAALSDPLIIGMDYRPDYFVDILTHELLHRLLTDNTTYEGGLPLVDHWGKLFGEDHSFQTLIHIPVHAGLEAVYRDVLAEPERLRRDIDLCTSQQHDYRQAWDYVGERGYNEIIAQIVTSHQVLVQAEAGS